MNIELVTPKAICIVSVHRTERTDEENQRLHNIVLNELYVFDIPYKEVIGCYQGTLEKSILLSLDRMDIAHAIAVRHSQDCFLVRYSDNAAYNVYAGMGMDYLGQWTEVTKEVALTKDGYTFDPSTGLYYTCIDEEKLKEVK